MAKRRYETISKGKSGAAGLSLIIAIAVVIFIIGAVGTFFALASTVDIVEESSGVIVQINLYGDDVVVMILGGDNLRKLDYIELIIDNFDLPESEAKKIVHEGEERIVYKSIAHQMKGEHMFGVRGYFKDGSSSMIGHHEMRFS